MMKSTFTLFLGFLLYISSIAQSTQNYSFFAGAIGSLTDMSGSTTLIGSNVLGSNTQANAILALPDDFRFLMMGYSSFPQFINVSTNGAINMAQNFADLSLFSPNTNRVGAFNVLPEFRIGTSPTGKVHYKVTGTQPNRVLVIEFLNLSFDNSPDIADITYQIRLYESSGIIDFVYGEMRNSSGNPRTAEIGFGSGNSENRFHSVNKDTEQSSTTTIHQNVIDEGIIAGLHTTNPNNRMIYRFTPNRPSSPGGVNITSSSGQQILTISPADNNPGYRYFVYRATDEAGPYGSLGSGTTTTFTSGNLEPNTTYYYQVFSAAEGGLGQFAATTAGTTLSPLNIQSTSSGGNWNESATWVGGIVPSQNDNVSITAGSTVNITSIVSCKSLSILGNILYTMANTQLSVINGSIFVANGGSIRANGSGIRNLVIRDGDLTNNGILEFTDANNAIVFELGNVNRIFSGTGTILGTDASGTPANTGIIRRFTVNRINNTFTDPVFLTIHQPFIISENLNLAFGFIENLSPLYLDNTAVAAGKTAGAAVSITHFGSTQAGIMGNLIFGTNATYNLNYTNANATGIINTGKELPQNFAINSVNITNGFGINLMNNLQAINISGNTNSPLFYGNHTITLGRSTTVPGGQLSIPIYGSGPITRWYGTQPINAGGGLGNFPFRFGTPESFKNRLANVAPVNGATSGGTVTIRHFDIPGQSNFSQPFFEESIGYVRRSNSYWQISTGNGLDAGDIEIRFFTEELPTPELFPDYPTANITLADAKAPGTFLAAIPRIPGYPIIRRSMNANDLTNSFYFGEADPLLPLKLITLKGQVQSGDALLTWETRQEVEVSHFEIERSVNGNQFTHIGRVNAKGGQMENSYAFRDVKLPPGNNFYRLKIVDNDGTWVYSQVLKLHHVLKADNVLYPAYPNPSRGQTAIRYQLAANSNVTIMLTDLNGRNTIIKQYNSQPAGLYNEQVNLKTNTNDAGRYQIRLVISDLQGRTIYQQSTPVIIY